MSEEIKNPDEFLEHESQLARESLRRLKGEMLDSLKRTADAPAWTRRYPWPSLGTAAVVGLGTGWALGRTLWRKKSNVPPDDFDEAAMPTASDQAAAYNEEKPSAASRLMGGLGTLTGALASAAVTAAAEAIKDMVTDSVQSALHPEPAPDASTGDDTAPPDQTMHSES
ncbi:MAG TPA: hypothetical protein VFE46_10605 [Pirellulales bacterium]|jgi:ElaB/YqjD/DUF883 family membrane-anchored ribosome-binding protein|nr:hypothetical protein [Pirellulales bacterium]